MKIHEARERFQKEEPCEKMPREQRLLRTGGITVRIDHVAVELSTSHGRKASHRSHRVPTALEDM